MPEPESQPPEPDRRAFMRVVVYGGAFGAAALLGVTAQLPVAAGEPGGAWAPVLSMADIGRLPVGVTRGLEITLARRDGWRVRSRVQRLYLTRKAEGETPAAFRLFSAVCPHAGCHVEHRDQEFVCPCHDARFDADGAVTDGPAPRGLDVLEAEIREREGAPWLYVNWQDFLPGTPERRVRNA